MNKKKAWAWLTALTLATGMAAQTRTVKIESPIVTEKDFVWYTEQKEAWKEAVRRNPKDEVAWLNYYTAARYMGWWGNSSDSIAREVIREMGKAIPKTYTYNYCAYCAVKLGHGLETDGDKYAETALTMLPEDMQHKDYDNWVCYLAMKGGEQRMRQMAKRYFDSGLYSENVLRYNHNELAGMEEGGIVIANGDAVVIPKWLIQEGMGKHRDKTVVCLSFLAVREYREWLFRKLGVELPTLKESTREEDYAANEQALLQAIIDRYGSKVYFSTTTPSKTMEPWKHHLYNEGLLLRYSGKPYGNLAVKRRNVEERYMMEYLLVSFRPEWTAGQRLSANYAILLADLLPYYAKHDKRRHDWLMRLLVAGVTNTSLDEDYKQAILKQLM